jgi:hypothetical protein
MAKRVMRNPLDGYDYVAEVPRGTPLLVESHDGRIWRLSRHGVRYHGDVSTRLHGARPARAPAAVAASCRIRAVLTATLGAGGARPAGGSIAVWRDVPHVAGSRASCAELSVYPGGWVCAWAPVYDDAPRVGCRQLRASESARLTRDLALAPRAVRLPYVTVTERHVEIRPESHDAATVALAASLPEAKATNACAVYACDPEYTAALLAPGARETFKGGPVWVPMEGTGWHVPCTIWRAASARIRPDLAPPSPAPAPE